MRREQKLQKWGSSYAVRIPKSMVDKLELSRNDTLEIKDVKSTLVIKKIDSVVTGAALVDCFNKFPFKASEGDEELDLSRDKSLPRDIEL